MAIQLAAVANSIASLNVSGVTIYDIDKIPAGLTGRYPAIIPMSDYVTDLSIEFNSFGSHAESLKTIYYTLHYRLLYEPIGSGRSNYLAPFAGMAEKATLFLDAILDIVTFTGGVDIVPVPIPAFGVVNDPAEVPFWGCDFALQIKEFDN